MNAIMQFFYTLFYYITWPIRALFYSPGKIFSPIRGLLNISVPARVAIFVAIFQIIFVVTAAIVFYNTEDRAAWNYWVTFWRVTVIIILMIVIPIVVYKALKLWLEGDVSRFPDIDHAWKAGLAALEEHGLALTETPLFLVLGSNGEDEEKALFDASRMGLNVIEIPQGPAALHWYANPDGIYLLLTNTCCTSRLAAIARQTMEGERSGRAPIVSAPARSGGGGDTLRGTIVAGADADESAPVQITTSGVVPGGDEGSAPGGDIRGTMMVSGETMIAGGGGAAPAAAAAAREALVLPSAEANEQDDRLEYVCRLIRRARQPLSPLNGMLTLLPYGLIKRSPREAIEVQRAVRRDLNTIRATAKVRCPVTALVVGLEEESGFRELVRRVGRDRAKAQRFGKGFTIWSSPLPQRLESLAAHACGSFEQWVYALFREKGSLSKPGNTKLYALLCEIRRNVQGRLAKILSGGFGHDPKQDGHDEPFLFGGCYFAAIGETEDRQAFVKGVFDKLPEQQEELDWTPAALAEDERYQNLAQAIMGIDVLLFLALLAMFIKPWQWFTS